MRIIAYQHTQDTIFLFYFQLQYVSNSASYAFSAGVKDEDSGRDGIRHEEVEVCPRFVEPSFRCRGPGFTVGPGAMP